MENQNTNFAYHSILDLIVLMLFILQILIIITIVNTNDDIPRYNFRRCCFRISNETTFYLSCREIAFQSSSRKQNNCEVKSINGNIAVVNSKGQGGTIKALSILLVNTGNGKWAKSNSTLKLLVRQNNPDIVIISESNFDKDNKTLNHTRNTDFKEYAFEDKFLPGCPYARMTIMIRTTINYSRVIGLENHQLITITA